MKRFLILFVFLSCRSVPPNHEVDHVLDNLHLHASKTNGKAYFDLFAENAVFFGTDINERWNKTDFEEYGKFRGTGVLKIVMGKWKIVQYNLLLPIPNDLFMNISKKIKNFYN